VSQPPPNFAAFDPAGRREPRTDLDYSLGSHGDRATVAALAYAVYGGSISQWHARLERALTRDRICLVIARHHGIAIGYGKADHRQPVTAEDAAPEGCYLTGVVVLPTWRRHGIGSELTLRLRDWIWQHEEHAWSVTNHQNMASVAMHERLGFKPVDQAASYLGIDFEGGLGILLRAHRPVAWPH